MEIYCTRPDCDRPLNHFADLDDLATFRTTQQKYCLACGMPLVLAERYCPTALLGRRGCRTTFLAIDRHTPAWRKCIVKQFQPAGQSIPEDLNLAQSLFEREAAILEYLGAKNRQIPFFYAFFPLSVSNPARGEDSQFFYLVREFIDGQTLAETLAARGTFSESEVTEILQEILKILEFVHNSGSLHGDIKPSNIIQQKKGLYYLIDFGASDQLAKAIGNSQGRSASIYPTGCTPLERGTDARVDPSSDLYALGMTAINLLTGRLPEDFYGSSHETWQWRQEAPTVSDRFSEFLNRLLQRSPDDRFGSAEAALQFLLAGSAIAHSANQLPAAQLSDPDRVRPTRQASPPISPPLPPAAIHPARSRFSSLEQVSIASFTGFEGALLSIGLITLLSMPGLVVACMAMGGVFFCQWQRIIEGKDFPILAGLSLALMSIPALRGNLSFPVVMAIALVAGAALVAALLLFTLIYHIVTRLMSR